jgi:putative transcriptional regulator
MDMSIFQIESNKATPAQGSLLVSAPFLKDYHFERSVVLLAEHSDEGSMGIVLNKHYRFRMSLSQLLGEVNQPRLFLPVFKGGPMSRETLFYVHRLNDLKGALPLGNGLYLNGDFNQMRKYILEGNPVEGMVRFYTGYAGWGANQLMEEIEADTWMVTDTSGIDLLTEPIESMWRQSMQKMGGKYAVWAKYPKYPSLN